MVKEEEGVTLASRPLGIRVPAGIYEELAQKAAEQDRTMSKMALIAITHYLVYEKEKAKRAGAQRELAKTKAGGFTD